MGLNTEECDSVRSVMRKWKARLEIWSNDEKRVSQWIQIFYGFLQCDSQLDFVSAKYQYVYYSNIAVDTK